MSEGTEPADCLSSTESSSGAPKGDLAGVAWFDGPVDVIQAGGPPDPEPLPWRYRLVYLAHALAAAGVVALVLRVVGPTLPGSDRVVWFRVGLFVAGLGAFIGAIAVAVRNVLVGLRRRSGGGGRTRHLLALCLALFGAASLGICIADVHAYSPPTVRPPESAIWAGYMTRRAGVSRVNATWTQPRVSSPRGESAGASCWVGLLGATGHTIEQIGTAGYCGGGARTIYDAWYELYPAPVVNSDLTIRPGDEITATVVSLGSDRFELMLSDGTNGGRIDVIRTARGIGSTGASIIVEEPDRTDIALAAFDPVRFTDCAIDGVPMRGLQLQSFEVSDRGRRLTTTSPVEEDGVSFTVTRR